MKDYIYLYFERKFSKWCVKEVEIMVKKLKLYQLNNQLYKYKVCKHFQKNMECKLVDYIGKVNSKK